MATLLLTVDGSAFAEQAIPHALARCTPADELLVLLVVDPTPIPLVPETTLTEVEVEKAQLYLNQLAQRLRERHSRVRSELVVGFSRDTVLAIAEREQPRLLVMASHGRTGWRRWLLGSVAESVIRRAPCPVWLVRCTEPTVPRTPWNEPVAPVTRVLLPLDLSQPSDATVEFLHTWVKPGTATLLLLSAGNLLWMSPDLRQEVAAELHREIHSRADALRDAGWHVDTWVDSGTAAEAIVTQAETQHVDLIVMASHGRTGVERWWNGSVAEQVLRYSPCPVALMRLAPAPIS